MLYIQIFFTRTWKLSVLKHLKIIGTQYPHEKWNWIIYDNINNYENSWMKKFFDMNFYDLWFIYYQKKVASTKPSLVQNSNIFLILASSCYFVIVRTLLSAYVCSVLSLNFSFFFLYHKSNAKISQEFPSIAIEGFSLQKTC